MAMHSSFSPPSLPQFPPPLTYPPPTPPPPFQYPILTWPALAGSQVILYGIVVTGIILLALCLTVRALYIRATGPSPVVMPPVWNGGQGNLNTGVGLDPELIEALPTMKYMSNSDSTLASDTSCVVCLDDYKENDELKEISSCRHRFHRHCIDSWLQHHTTCPVCRLSLLPQATEAPEEQNEALVEPSGRAPGNLPSTTGVSPSEESHQVCIRIPEDSNQREQENVPPSRNHS